MIHYNSTDPVLIKKISLRIWTLRSEIESVLREQIEEPPSDLNQNAKILQLKQEYCIEKPSQADATEDKVAEGEEETSEENTEGEEEATEEKAEGKEEAPEEKAEGEEEATEEKAEGEEETDEEATEGEDSDQTEKIFIKQRTPRLERSEMVNGRAILGEIDIDKIFFFSERSFIEGQSIVIEFLIPKHFVINARVMFCRAYNLKSRIISENRLPFRGCAKFSFLKKGEMTLLREFVRSIEPDVPKKENKKGAKKSKSEDEDDDLDELDDL